MLYDMHMPVFSGTETTTFSGQGLQMKVEPRRTVTELRVSLAGSLVYADSFKQDETLTNAAINAIVTRLSGVCARRQIRIKDVDIAKMLRVTLDTAGVTYA